MGNWANSEHANKDIAHQGAALLEAAGENVDLRNRIRKQLSANESWQAMVKSEVTKGLEIPGLKPEDQSILPGAVEYKLPETPHTRIDVVLNPALSAWKTQVSEKTTYDRAMQMAREFQEPHTEITQIGDQLTQAVSSL